MCVLAYLQMAACLSHHQPPHALPTHTRYPPRRVRLTAHPYAHFLPKRTSSGMSDEPAACQRYSRCLLLGDIGKNFYCENSGREMKGGMGEMAGGAPGMQIEAKHRGAELGCLCVACYRLPSHFLHSQPSIPIPRL